MKNSYFFTDNGEIKLQQDPKNIWWTNFGKVYALRPS